MLLRLEAEPSNVHRLTPIRSRVRVSSPAASFNPPESRQAMGRPLPSSAPSSGPTALIR